MIESETSRLNKYNYYINNKEQVKELNQRMNYTLPFTIDEHITFFQNRVKSLREDIAIWEKNKKNTDILKSTLKINESLLEHYIERKARLRYQKLWKVSHVGWRQSNRLEILSLQGNKNVF